MGVSTERVHRAGSALAMICGALAAFIVAGCAGPAKSPSSVTTTAARSTTRSRLPADGGACSAQPPGCGSAPGTAESLAGVTWSGAPAPPLSAPAGRGAGWRDRLCNREMAPSPCGPGPRRRFWGGSGANGSLLMNGASYDPASRTWAMLPAVPLRPDAQRLQAIVWTGTQMVVIQPG